KKRSAGKTLFRKYSEASTLLHRNWTGIWTLRKKAVEDWDFLQEPMDVFMLSLFFADLIQALGAVLDIKWINEGKVETGPFCTAQGIIQQLGETGVAITTLIIALYTFIVVRWRKGMDAVIISKLVTVTVWAFIIIMIIVGNTTRGPNYEEPTPYWCWIGENHTALRIIGEYVWFWITLGAPFLVCSFGAEATSSSTTSPGGNSPSIVDPINPRARKKKRAQAELSQHDRIPCSLLNPRPPFKRGPLDHV
ncbi:hypothetical protein ARMGADRAFT_1145799, partial [Armillaria gallica]